MVLWLSSIVAARWLLFLAASGLLAATWTAALLRCVSAPLGPTAETWTAMAELPTLDLEEVAGGRRGGESCLEDSFEFYTSTRRRSPNVRHTFGETIYFPTSIAFPIVFRLPLSYTIGNR